MTISIPKEMDSKFTVLEIQKKRVLFTVNKINRRTAPYGLYIYDVEHTAGKPYKIKNKVITNHFGTIISKENYENIIHELNKFKACEYPEIDSMELDCLYDYDKLCSIKLDSNAIISDPLYTVERWYSVGYLGRLQNVLPGNYNCFIQKSELGYIANIKVVHEDYDPDKYEPKDIEDCINIRIDSDMCGIFNNEERLIKNRYEKDQYTIIDNNNNNNNINYLTDGEAFIIQYPGSGYGDESYRCYLSRNTDCQIVGIRVEFINYDEYYEEEK